MKNSMVKKVVIVSLVACLAIAMLLLPVACGEKAPEKKAIIILPGIMGSNIVDTTNGESLWAPLKYDPNFTYWDLGDITVSKVMNLLQTQPDIKNLLFDAYGDHGAMTWIDKMMVNADGSTNNPNAAQELGIDGTAKYPLVYPYGTVNYYEKTFNFLKEKFGDEYEVRMFEYDWRLDNSVSAEKLEKFVADNKYDKIVLVGHSMGGVLASTYIARSEANQAKVEKFISCGTPFFGAHKAVRVIDNPLSMLEGDMSGLLNTVKKLVDNSNGKGTFDAFFTKFMAFVHDLPTIYQLMPYADEAGNYTSDYEDTKDLGFITIDGRPVTDYNEFVNFMKSRDYINDRCIGKMVDWQNEQYVTKDGKKVHASKVVDTRYIVGTDLDTDVCVNFDANGTMLGDGKCCSSTKYGDGTVPAYSACCGMKISAENKIYEFKGVSHGDLVYNDDCLNKIAELISEA